MPTTTFNWTPENKAAFATNEWAVWLDDDGRKRAGCDYFACHARGAHQGWPRCVLVFHVYLLAPHLSAPFLDLRLAVLRIPDVFSYTIPSKQDG